MENRPHQTTLLKLRHHLETRRPPNTTPTHHLEQHQIPNPKEPGMKKISNPFLEHPRHRDRNQDIENNSSVHPATLANGDEGVVFRLGNYSTCLTLDGAINLAKQIVHCADLYKGNK